MKQILFIALFLLTACGQTSKKGTMQQEDNGKDRAITFINSYINKNDSSGIMEWIDANDMTTTAFKSELKKILDEAWEQDPEIGPGFDPILNAQDFDDEGFELDSIDEKSGYIILKGRKMSHFKVTVNVVKENGKWLVNGCGIVNIANDFVK